MRGKRYVEELGRPLGLLAVGRSEGGYTAIKARKGKPGHRVKREPERWTGKPCGEAEEYYERESPPDVQGESYQAEYSARGKATYTGKDLTEVCSPQRKLVPDTVGSDQHKPTSPLGE
jgi:hypothetical protein